ncbi:hypothetical protein [Limisphaera sp. 4302-co]|uniref:hypothetical protein n=1 Tax=Limisphaera sp. 4302-co TaxID=3400417 RepID=UPI003C287D7C
MRHAREDLERRFHSFYSAGMGLLMVVLGMMVAMVSLFVAGPGFAIWPWLLPAALFIAWLDWVMDSSTRQ